MKPLAPFGQYLSTTLRRNNGMNEVAIIFMGEKGWERAHDFQDYLPYTLCLPHRSSPLKYEWPLRNCEVYLVDTDASAISFIRFCAITFFSYGAKLINYISASQSFVIEKGISYE